MGTAATAIVGKVGGSVAQGFVQRGRLWAMKRGILQGTDPTMRLQQYPGPHVEEFRGIQIVEKLPRGLTQRDINQIIRSRAFRVTAQQLIAAYAVDAGQEHFERALLSLRREFSRALPGADTPAFQSYYEEFARLLNASCADVASRLRDTPMNPNVLFEWADAILATATLESIERHLESLDAINALSEETLTGWAEAYRGEFIRQHSKVRLPDLTRRRMVDHRKIFVARTFAFDTIGAALPFSTSDMLQLVDRTVVLGDPGAGKSTVSENLALAWSESGEIAFYIRMREIKVEASGFNLCSEIERVCSTRYQHPPAAGVVESLLTSGSALVVMDGMDEVATPEHRQAASQIIESASSRYPLAKFLITARRVGYSAVRLDEQVFTEVSLLSFGPSQVERYAHNWFALSSSVDDPIEDVRSTQEFVRDFMAASETIRDLRSNPLMLAFICILYRGRKYIPRNRPAIYQKCVDMLVHEWDVARGIRTIPGDVELYTVALAEIAAHIYYREEFRHGVTTAQLQRIATETLFAEAIPDKRHALAVAKDLVDICKGRAWIFTDVGIDESSEVLYNFTHASFLEYFTAFYLVRSTTTPEELADRVSEQVFAGQGEVLTQMCLMLVGQRIQLGAGRALLRLIEQAERRDNALAGVEIITRASDVVMINESAFDRLIGIFVQLLPDPGSRRLAEILMDLEYRHADAVRPVLGKHFAAVDDARTVALMRKAPWIWNFSIENGITTVRFWQDAASFGPEDLVLRAFSGALHELRGGGPSCTAEWMVDSLLGGERDDRRRTVAALRDLDALVESGYVPTVKISRTDVGRLHGKPDIAARFGRALQKSIGRGPAETFAMLILSLTLIEILVAWAPYETLLHSEGLIASLWNARESRSAARLPDGLEFFPATKQELVREWAEGTVSFLWPASGAQDEMGVS